MGNRIDLNQISREVPTFDFTPPPKQAAVPAAVLQFERLATQYVQTAHEQRTLAAVYEAQLHLVHKFMECRRAVAKRERHRIGTVETPSLWSVFEAAYERLLALELSITPLLALSPVAAEQPVEDEPPGLYIGDEMP